MYAALSVYLVGLLFLALGLYRLWSGMVQPRWLNWLLLPGTLVAEMAYIFGCLVTGGEVRHAKLMGGGKGGKSKASSGEGGPSTEGSAKLGFLGPLIAALMVVIACGAGILVAHWALGEPVLDQFDDGGAAGGLVQELPDSQDAFWKQVKHQVDLLGRMGASWVRLNWLDWHVLLFVYLAVCLGIRLAPVNRPLRPALLAVILASVLIAVIGLAWQRFNREIMAGVWPLLTYVWTLLLFLLTATLVIRALVGLYRAFAGKEKAPKSSEE